MVELLIHRGRGVDGDGDWDDGDIVVRKPDGHGWGSGESYDRFLKDGGDPKAWRGVFYILKLPGVPESAVDDYMEPESSIGPDGKPIMTKRRRYKVDMSQLDTQRELSSAHELTRALDANTLGAITVKT